MSQPLTEEMRVKTLLEREGAGNPIVAENI